MKKNHESTSRNRAAHSASHKKKQESSPITPKFIFESMRRWWTIALPTGLVIAAICSFLIWHFFEEVYESRALLRIRSNPAYLIAPEVIGESENYMQNELAILRSPLVLREVITKNKSKNLAGLSNAADPVKTLQKMVRVESMEGSELHYVYVTTKSASDSKQLCDAIVDEYLNYHSSDEASTFQDLIKTVTEQVENYEREVRQLQNQLRAEIEENEDLLVTNALENSGLSEEEILIQTPLTQLKAAREIKRIDLETKRQDIESLQKRIWDKPFVEPAEYEVVAAVETSGQLTVIRSAIESVESLISNSRHGPDHPEVLQLKRTLASKQQELVEATERVRKEVRLQLQTRHTEERRKRLERYEEELASMEHQLQAYDKAIAGHIGEAGEKNQNSLEIELTLQELADARKLRDQFKTRLTLLTTEKMRPNQVMPQNNDGSWATVPPGPVEKYPIRQMSLASLASLVFPFVIAFLWELRVRRVSNAEQVADHSQVPIVGEVAALPARRGPRRSSRRLERQMKLFEESVDTLRTSFFLTLKSDECQVISITSAVANEGKTTVASQLALSTSRASNKRVLLIDGDLRAPDIHRVFGIENELGLTDVLRGDCELDEAIAASWEDNLFVLPGGRLRGESPHQLVSGGKIEEIIAQLRNEFDVIVIDTSPVLSSSESLLINQVADHTLVSVMRDVSRIEQVKKLAERMQISGVHVAGCIMNGVSHSRYAYSYGVYEPADS